MTTEKSKLGLYMPDSFWTMLISALDKKVEAICKDYGWGDIGLQIVVRKGIVKDIVFSDEVRLRQDKKDNQT